MRDIAVSALEGYQRYLSPRKGFCCAHRVLTGGASCSQFAKRVIAHHGLWVGLKATVRRFQKCKVSARQLSTMAINEQNSREGQAEAPAEPCPFWSRSKAIEVTACCCWPW
ncbi:MAG: membrane protein insertion efficiency factor YidD [Hydrogenophaga sp.]|uniref:membrane protein insertion efficiency factor YidD n=1 Tax=Hydrogenophaga sp. TaxID=1904254 RepID=UPI002A05028D|nr:membrane protein insertion efficiency factor YidD [Hydrogenophaga sp.]